MLERVGGGGEGGKVTNLPLSRHESDFGIWLTVAVWTGAREVA